jgi:hypothetical protein
MGAGLPVARRATLPAETNGGRVELARAGYG